MRSTSGCNNSMLAAEMFGTSKSFVEVTIANWVESGIYIGEDCTYKYAIYYMVKELFEAVVMSSEGLA